MTKWTFGHTYVYYIEELDELYTASYLPPNPKMKKDVPFHDMTTVRYYRDGFLESPDTVYFNPDISLFWNLRANPMGKSYSGILIGEL